MEFSFIFLVSISSSCTRSTITYFYFMSDVSFKLFQLQNDSWECNYKYNDKSSNGLNGCSETTQISPQLLFLILKHMLFSFQQ